MSCARMPISRGLYHFIEGKEKMIQTTANGHSRTGHLSRNLGYFDHQKS